MKFVFYRKPRRSGGRYSYPCGVEHNGMHVPLSEGASRIMLALFCHPILSEMDLVEIRWPDPDTMPDWWRSCLSTETSTINKQLARLDARIVCRQGHYKLLEPKSLEMAA